MRDESTGALCELLCSHLGSSLNKPPLRLYDVFAHLTL